ncbi:hypothetical protein ACPDIX_09190 [Limisphaera sp. 4302-co]
MKAKNARMSLMGWAAATAVVLQAQCPVPTNDGMCGYASQVGDPSNGCCEITGPGQIQRKTCKGTSGTRDCDNNAIDVAYVLASYPIVTNGTEVYCNRSYDPPYYNYCYGAGENPRIVLIKCNQAVERSSTNCRNGSSDGGNSG